MLQKKLRITLQSFNHKSLKDSCNKIITILSKDSNGISICGPISLPTRKRSYCVLRSPHVNKDSREQFEIRRYKKILEISPFSPEIMSLLLSIEIPPGVSTRLFQQK